LSKKGFLPQIKPCLYLLLGGFLFLSISFPSFSGPRCDSPYARLLSISDPVLEDGVYAGILVRMQPQREKTKDCGGKEKPGKLVFGVTSFIGPGHKALAEQIKEEHGEIEVYLWGGRN